jgi:hypothetical protein
LFKMAGGDAVLGGLDRTQVVNPAQLLGEHGRFEAGVVLLCQREQFGVGEPS